MTMRTPLFLLVAALAVACGGGGGGEPTTGNQTPDPTTDERRAQAMLERCGADAVDVLLDTLDVFRIAPGATGLPITLRAIAGDVIPFGVDLDGDMTEDVLGAFSFVDDQGQPFMPFTQEQLDGGIDALLSAIATLPNGTTMRASLQPDLERGLENAELALRYLGGLPVAVDGVVNYAADSCRTRLLITNASPLSLLGDTPSLPVTLAIEEGGDVLEGSITFNGTDTASADVSLNGGETLAFTLDLTTGAVSLRRAG